MNKSSSAKKRRLQVVFNRMAAWVTQKTGSPGTFMIALLLVLLWLIAGPLFGFSDTWQLVINTGTTIITFLMVFIIQQSQNKDTAAIQLKLNELIACNKEASNRLIDIEDITDDELKVLKNFYIKLSQKAKKEKDLHSSHSLDEATANHRSKSIPE